MSNHPSSHGESQNLRAKKARELLMNQPLLGPEVSSVLGHSSIETTTNYVELGGSHLVSPTSTESRGLDFDRSRHSRLTRRIFPFSASSTPAYVCGWAARESSCRSSDRHPAASGDAVCEKCSNG